MSASAEMLAVAVTCFREGRSQESLEICLRILESDPANGDVLQLLSQIAENRAQHGLVIEPLHRAIKADPNCVRHYELLADALTVLGRHAESAICYQQILLLRPHSEAANYNLGNSLNSLGQIAEAIDCYRRVLQINPSHGAAYNNLGTALKAQGDLDEAIACCRRAAALMPDFAGAHYNLGNALHLAGQLQEAVTCFQRALQLNPQLTVAHNNLGNVFRDQRKFAEAMECFLFALKLLPGYVEAHNNLGSTLQDLGKLDEAVACFLHAIELNSDIAESHFNLGNVLLAQGKLIESIARQRRALELKPELAAALNNQGTAYYQLGMLDDAATCYRRAIELKPDNADWFNNLGIVRKDQGNLAEATGYFRKSLEMVHKADVHSNLLFCLVYDPTQTLETIYLEHVRWAEKFGRPKSTWLPHANTRDPHRRLRVGYVSGDYRSHAIACFMEPILRCHDHGRFEIFCYANNMLSDDVTRRLQHFADHWRWVSRLNDEDLVRIIRDDQIDILVDLSGHTAGNRLTALAQKPAPLQVTYLGYPATTGLEAIDYRFTDEVLNPPDEPTFHVEQLYRLPVGSACFAPREDCPEVVELPALSRGFLTFGAPHNLAKMNGDVFNLWSRLLHTIPTARLSLFRDSLHGPTADQICTEFVQRGIAPERLEIRSTSSTINGYRAYMAKYGDIDICVDTFPANAGTTGCESLWMGVPWLAIYGDRFFGRQTASLLNRLGLLDWVCRRVDDVIEKAVYWNGHIEQLAEIRRNLRSRFRESPLGDPDRYTRGLEEAYRDIWIRWCEGRDHSA